ncbi:MAG: hypothetical protein WCH82_05545 [Mycobacteriaceae bacterium]
MRAVVLLAHSARLEPNGTMHALGLGWTTTTTPAPQHSLIVFVEVQWSEIGTSFPIHAELVDGDGNEVARTEDSVINARRHPAHPAGTAVTIPFTATIPALPLVAGQRYQWRVSIGGHMGEDWLAGFTVTGPDAAPAPE